MLKSPLLVLTLWVTTLLVTLPLAVVMEDTLRADIGASQVQDDMRGGLDLGWLEEFHYRNQGLAQSLTPGRVGSVLAFENLELGFSGGWWTENRQVAATGGLFLLVWILIQGGAISHLTRPESKLSLGEFLGRSGSFFFRFVRIAVIVGSGYYGVYRLALWLFPAIERWTRDVTVEKTVLGYNLAGAVGIVLLMAFLHMVAEYAKIATVTDDRRSMIIAVGHAFRQVVKHPLQAFGLMGLLLMALLVLQGALFLAMPDARHSGIPVLLLSFLIGQGYLLMRSALRVARFSSEIELYNRWRGR